MKREIKHFIKYLIFKKNLSPTFVVVPRAAVGDFGSWAHGSNFAGLTAALEVKLSSRTLEDIKEVQFVSFSSSGNDFKKNWLWSSVAVGV